MITIYRCPLPLVSLIYVSSFAIIPQKPTILPLSSHFPSWNILLLPVKEYEDIERKEQIMSP